MKKRVSVASILGCTLLLSCTQTTDKSDIDLRVEKLLSQMTLEEKIGQMNQISFWGNSEELAPQVKAGNIGSLLNVADATIANAFQKIAVEESRLGIPLLIGRDVIHGFKTIFPIPLGQAATFNPELVKECAQIAALEASATGINWTFAPMLDISRDARWGRIAESFGECPYLTGVMGVAMVNGFQGDNLSNKTSIAACPKHFVGYGAAEAGKDYNSTNIPPLLMRNLYLPPFEDAINAGAATIMSAFNDNDGIPMTANKELLTNVLRKEWKFDGIIVSDWTSTTEMIMHGFAKDDKEVAEKSVNAGVNIEMMGMSYITHLKELINEGKVKINTIDDAVRNILRLKFRLGLFENPYVDEDQQNVFYKEENLKIAHKAAEESIILLKNNNNTLPLSKNLNSLAIIGPMADAPHEQLGTWIFDGEKSKTITPLNAIKNKYDETMQIFYEKGLEFSRDRDKSQFWRAVQAAQSADATILFIGEESILTGEAHSLADINLKGAQKDLVRELKKVSKKLIIVVMAGRPLTISDELEAADALLYSFHLGTMGGTAIADLLFGETVPSGKLPVTFPKEVGQIPIYYNHNNTGRPADNTETHIYDIPLEAEQTSLGMTSFHLDAGLKPLFPFGFGLSYTTFEYDFIKLNKHEVTDNETLIVTFTLTNTGDFDATEVVQLYTRQLVGSIVRPVKELKAFQRIFLKSGESQKVTFSLPIQELAFFGIDGQRKVEHGSFKVWVGGDSNAKLGEEFMVVR
ncbi:MAG: beta-glucosidase BglX [Marinilabiliaceae bacterium]|nr:beta-glucosidase BglX [Marinilabiliaceae bacterium]